MRKVFYSNDLVNKLLSSLEEYYKSKRLADFVLKQLVNAVFNRPLCLFSERDKTDTLLWEKLEYSIFEITSLDKPYQYILEKTSFYNVALGVVPPVFIPRVETEELMAYIGERLSLFQSEYVTIADFFSGTGCMGISLLKLFYNGRCDAFDIDHQAVVLSAKNARDNGVRSRYKILHKNSLNLKKAKKYSIVLANPPYISLKDYLKLDLSVQQWESKNALTDSRDGSGVVRKTIEQAFLRSRQDSLIVVELCSSYAHVLYEEIKKKYSTCFVFLWKDQYLKNRAIIIAKGKYVLFFEKCV